MYVPSRDIVKVLAERFFNVEEVQLDRVSFLTDNGLHAVRRWPNLTHLDASGPNVLKVTDVGMGYLRSLKNVQCVRLDG